MEFNNQNGTGSEKPQWIGSSNILVVVRCRPPSEAERKAREEEVVRVIDGKTLIIKDPGHMAENEMRKKRLRDRPYAFDHSFDKLTPTEQVYGHTTKFLVEGVVAGHNATVFAYGATGSGKTHTMLGSRSSPGLMVLTLQDLYKCIERTSKTSGRNFRVTLSYVEVYNENIRDLLSSSDEYLDLREDPIKGNCVAGVSEHSVDSTGDIMGLLTEGNRRRSQEPTAANKESSRSHAVLQIHVHSKDPAKPRAAAKVGKFSLIDLAGSERAANTKNSGIRLLEGANINRSLLALGNCITALVAGKGSFVPYRDSKLTRLLKDSLGGNCKTVMISCISPAGASFEETCNTLKYANRAKNIKTNLKRAPEVSAQAAAAQVVEYENLITGLRVEVATLKHKLATTGVHGGGAFGVGGGNHNSNNNDNNTNNSSSNNNNAIVGMALAATAATGNGGGMMSPAAAAMRRASAFVNNGAGGGLAAAALSSPSLRRSGIGRAISPIRSPDGDVGTADGEDRNGADAVVGFIPVTGGGNDNNADGRIRSSPSSSPLSAAFNIPDGFILINAAEASAAAERLRVLREALVSNFQERMQLRRSLIELQTQNVVNQAEVGRRQVDVARWEQGQHALNEHHGLSSNDGSSSAGSNGNGTLSPFTPSGKTMVATQAAAAAARREIMELQSAVSANNKIKTHMLTRLEAATRESEEIRTQLDDQCNSDERRELLSLEYRVCLLELEKVELEQSGLLAARQLQAQAVEIKKLKLALKMRDKVLKAATDALAAAGLGGPGGPASSAVSSLVAVDAELSGAGGGKKGLLIGIGSSVSSVAEDDDDEDEDDDEDDMDESSSMFGIGGGGGGVSAKPATTTSDVDTSIAFDGISSMRQLAFNNEGISSSGNNSSSSSSNKTKIQQQQRHDQGNDVGEGIEWVGSRSPPQHQHQHHRSTSSTNNNAMGTPPGKSKGISTTTDGASGNKSNHGQSHQESKYQDTEADDDDDEDDVGIVVVVPPTANSPRHTKAHAAPPPPGSVATPSSSVAIVPAGVPTNNPAISQQANKGTGDNSGAADIISPSRATSWIERAVELVKKGVGRGSSKTRDSSVGSRNSSSSNNYNNNNNNAGSAPISTSSSVPAAPLMSVLQPHPPSAPAAASSSSAPTLRGRQPTHTAAAAAVGGGEAAQQPQVIPRLIQQMQQQQSYEFISTMEIKAALQQPTVFLKQNNNSNQNGHRLAGVPESLSSSLDENDNDGDEERGGIATTASSNMTRPVAAAANENMFEGRSNNYGSSSSSSSSSSNNNNTKQAQASSSAVSATVAASGRPSIAGSNKLNLPPVNSNKGAANIKPSSAAAATGTTSKNNNYNNNISVKQNNNNNKKGRNEGKEAEGKYDDLDNNDADDDTEEYSNNDDDKYGGPARPSLSSNNNNAAAAAAAAGGPRGARKGAVWQNNIVNKAVVVKGLERGPPPPIEEIVAPPSYISNNNNAGFSKAARAATDLSHAFSAYGGGGNAAAGGGGSGNNNNRKVAAPSAPRNSSGGNKAYTFASNNNNNNAGGGRAGEDALPDPPGWNSNGFHGEGGGGGVNVGGRKGGAAIIGPPSSGASNNGGGPVVRGGRVIRGPDERALLAPGSLQGSAAY